MKQDTVTVAQDAKPVWVEDGEDGPLYHYQLKDHSKLFHVNLLQGRNESSEKQGANNFSEFNENEIKES